MEVPGLEVESELQLLAYTTVTAMSDLSRVCDLHHSSRKLWILNPQSEARNQAHVLMDTSQIHFTVPQWELHPGNFCIHPQCCLLLQSLLDPYITLGYLS